MRQPIPRSEFMALFGDSSQCQCYVSPGLAPLEVDGFVPSYHVRVALICATGSGTGGAPAMAAALDQACAAVAERVDAALAWPCPGDLLAPRPGTAWARVGVEDRAELLHAALAIAATHAREIAVLDLGETSEPGFLALLRREQQRGGPAMLGVTIEHAFFSLVFERLEAEGREPLVAVPGEIEVDEAHPAVGDDGRVIAPLTALAGLVLASLAEVAVCQRLALRQRPPPAPLAPALAAALQAGYELLAPRLCNLLPREAREGRQ